MKVLTYPKPVDLLPHQSPMLLVKEIESYEPEVGLVASTDVPEDLMFFKGHFPGYPMLPGVILVEMIFQTCGLFGRMEASHMISNGEGDMSQKKMAGRAIKIENMTFPKPVFPNEKLRIEVSFKKRFMAFSTYKGKVFDEAGYVVAKGEVTVHLSEAKN